MIFTWLDILTFCVTIFSGITAMMRGAFREILALVSLALACFITLYSYKFFVPFIHGFISSKTISTVLAAMVIFLVSLIILSLLSIKLANSISNSITVPIDRFFGLVYGVARGFLIMAMGVFLMSNIIDKNNDWLVKAKTYSILNNTGKTIFSFIPDDFLDLDNIFTKIKINSKKNNIDENS